MTSLHVYHFVLKTAIDQKISSIMTVTRTLRFATIDMGIVPQPTEADIRGPWEHKTSRGTGTRNEEGQALKT